MKHAIVCGSLNMDHVCRSPRIPIPGETILGYDYMKNSGGKGGNQAAALGRLGIKTYMLGCVGSDSDGQLILEDLKRSRVLVSEVIQAQVHTGTAHIAVEDSGENNIIVIPGANSAMRPERLAASEALIKTAGVLVAQLEIPMETVIGFFKMGKEAEAYTVLNPAPMPADGLPDALLKYVDLMVVNESEIFFLTGVNVGDAESFAQAAGQLHQKGIKEIICTLGSQGAYYSNRESEEILYQRAEKVTAVDTTCAGDSFIGAYLVKLMAGEALKDCMAFASKAAAITVTRKGAQGSIPFLEEVNGD